MNENILSNDYFNAYKAALYYRMIKCMHKIVCPSPLACSAAQLNVIIKKMQNLLKFHQWVCSNPSVIIVVSSASPNTAAVPAYLCVHSNDTSETKIN